MRIVVLDGYALNPGDNPWNTIAALGELVVHDRTSPDQLPARAAGAQVLLTNKVALPGDILRDLPELRFIGVLATGYNIVDTETARELGIIVSNVPEYGTDSVAQYTFALILELCHQVGLHDRSVKAGDWTRSPDWSFWRTPLIELAGLTLGIIGYGRIGRRVGQIAEAFGMKLHPVDQEGGEQVYAVSDFITLHCPLTPQSSGMINARTLGMMKRGAMLINTARGPLVVEQDLADALNSGHLAGAAVDVVSSEPIEPGNPLLKARNCIITPHLAWATLAARRRLMRTTADNIAAFARGRPINVVNGPVS
jgi:glycerate dehydrogenase